jgi:putative ABC transport system permease protein
MLSIKLLRDLRAALWQFLAITFVSGLGVAMYYGPMVSYERQKASYQLSYEKLAFADVVITFRRAPSTAAAVFRTMPIVIAIEGRISDIVEVEQDYGRRPRVIGRMISVPVNRVPGVNRLKLLEGRPLGSRSERELLLETQFAKANGYRPGDKIYPRFLGRRVSFTVAGIVASPEFIYPELGTQFTLPMPGVFGAMFVPEKVLGPMLGMTGQINEIVVRSTPKAARSIGEAMKRRLRAYGPDNWVLQADQPSNKLLISDLEGNRAMLVIMPLLFLGSAALAVGLMLARWVQAQRGIVGFLRASGFSARSILVHFLMAGQVIGLGGSVVGVGLGSLLAIWYSSAYDRLLQTPFHVDLSPFGILLTAIALAQIACLLGALAPARQAASTPPADAMRGELPPRIRRMVKIRVPPALLMPIRSIMRRPLRTLGSACGVASGVTLMVIAGTFQHSIDEVLDGSLEDFKRYDVTVSFVPERSQSIVTAMAHWPGVNRAEGTLDIPARVNHGDLQKDTVLMGFAPDSRLRTLHDDLGRSIRPSDGTIVFGDMLAKRVRAEQGDLLKAAYPQNIAGRRAEAWLRAGPRAHTFIGLPGYMNMQELRRRFAARLQMPPDAVTGAVLSVAPGYLPVVRNRLNSTDGVALVLTYAEMKKQIDDLTSFGKTFIAMMFMMGAGMAFAVIYTVTDIVLWERTRELATLRTLGFGMGDIARIVSLENLLVAGFGALAAIYPAMVLACYMLEAVSSEGYTMIAHADPNTYLFALAGAIAVVPLAQWPGLRRIRRMDLAEAIRLRE